jgi:hypothetical protein
MVLYPHMSGRQNGGVEPGAMAEVTWTNAERQKVEVIALALVETCVRNTQLEDLHAGKFPGSAMGDYSDVKVVTPYGEIPWKSLSRLSDPEMKALMIEIVDRVFTFLQYPEELARLGAAMEWDRPKLDPNLMRSVQRRAGSSLPSQDGEQSLARDDEGDR